MFEGLTNHSPIVPVILCGGSGTRLWPLSRRSKPKPFFAMVGNHSMLQAVAAAVSDSRYFADPVVVCNDAHAFMVRQQLEEVGIRPRALIQEPEGRNTAPAIALAALQVALEEPNATLLVLPSDHHIAEPAKLVETVLAGRPLAEGGALVTFGIKPDRPETGYGYIRRGMPVAAEGCYFVDRFVEKPDVETAADYVASGNYLWNSGMFMFKAFRVLHEFYRYEPDILQGCVQAWTKPSEATDTVTLDPRVFGNVRSISIDHALMEKTANAAVVEARFRWSDIGSWQAMWEVAEKDATGNAIHGRAILQECRNTLVRGGDPCASGRIVAAVGVEDLVIVDTPDAVLVAPRGRSQEVKAVVERLSIAGSAEAVNHADVERPWGSYRSVDRGPSHQVKHITVHPGGKLSHQYHNHRAEHWIVVAGRADVQVEDEIQQLGPNESVFIPVGARHRLCNTTDEPVHLIEVQYGTYLGEDDIVRLDDIYGRTDAPESGWAESESIA